jgi:hypothetical protein
MSFGVVAAGAVSNGMSGLVVVAATRPPSKAMAEGGLQAREAGVHGSEITKPAATGRCGETLGRRSLSLLVLHFPTGDSAS